MNAVLNSTSESHNSLPLSLRMVRLVLSFLLVIALVTEPSLSSIWQLSLIVLAIYALITGLFGRDPLYVLLQVSFRRLPDHALDVVAQVECFAIGLMCIVAGIVHHNANSLVMALLPFFGIYPVLLCALKHDLLGYLLQSYRRDLDKKAE
ncbi:hypothetical protein [Kaarinaea lacus]